MFWVSSYFWEVITNKDNKRWAILRKMTTTWMDIMLLQEGRHHCGMCEQDHCVQWVTWAVLLGCVKPEGLTVFPKCRQNWMFLLRSERTCREFHVAPAFRRIMRISESLGGLRQWQSEMELLPFSAAAATSHVSAAASAPHPHPCPAKRQSM